MAKNKTKAELEKELVEKEKKLEELIPTTDEKRERKRKLRIAKIWYYVDEFSIFLIVLAGVVLSDAIQKRAQGQLAGTGDLFLDSFNLVISAIISITAYASINTRFKYNDKGKPRWITRVSTGLGLGVMWRTLQGLK